jgi:hypothetical protein
MKKTISAVLLFAVLIAWWTVAHNRPRFTSAAVLPVPPPSLSSSPAAEPSTPEPVAGVELTRESAGNLRDNRYVRMIEGPSYGGDVLRIFREHPELRWTETQKAQAQAIYNAIQRKRLLHEGSIAEVELVSNEEASITIPAYAEVGRELRESFWTELRTKIGAADLDQFAAVAEVALTHRMRGYGQQPQQIAVRYERANDSYVFVHEAKFTDSKGVSVEESSTSRLTRNSLDVYVGYAALLPR